MKINKICKILIITQLVLLSFVLNLNLKSETKLTTELQNKSIIKEDDNNDNEDDVLDSFQNDDDLVPDSTLPSNKESNNSEIENFIQRRENKNPKFTASNYGFKDVKEKDTTQKQKEDILKDGKAQALQINKKFHAASPERISGSFKAFRAGKPKGGDTFDSFLEFLKYESDKATKKYHSIKKSAEAPWDYSKK